MTSMVVSRPIRITKHRRRTTNRSRDMLDFRFFGILPTLTPMIIQGLNSVLGSSYPFCPLGQFNFKDQGEFGKVVYGFLLMPNSNFGRRMRCLQDFCDGFWV